MKRLTIVLLSVVVVVVLASSVFAAGKPAPPPPPPPPVTFVEEPIPEGKAIIYIYNSARVLFNEEGSGFQIVFSHSGPLAVLPGTSYFTFVTDPGTVKIFFVVGSGGQYGSGLIAKEIVMDAVAGQASFVALNGTVPADKAKTGGEILYCKKVE